jgi:putative PIN family toxin of toxin-antitoxin system
MAARLVALDTNVVVAGLRSRRGASFRLLSLVGNASSFKIALSVPLVLEYESVLKRQSKQIGLSHVEIDGVLDYLCGVASLHEVFYLWRPTLRDPNDDMVLELAVGAGCESIITFSVHDFEPASTFAVRIEGPRSFLKRIGEVK